MRRPINPRSASTRPAMSCVITTLLGVGHQLRPTPIEPTVVALAVAVIAGQCPELLVEALVPKSHFVAEGVAPGDHAASGLGATLPIVHIVLLESTRGTEAPHSGQPERFLDLRRGHLVDIDPRPHLGLVRPPRVPDPECARRSPEHREIGEYRTDDRFYPAYARPEALRHLRSNLFLIFQDLRHRRVGDRVRADSDNRMAIAGRHHDPKRVRVDTEVAARARLDRREMAPRDVIAVTTEIFSGEFPVARHNPFVHAADDLDPALATVKERVLVPRRPAE